MTAETLSQSVARLLAAQASGDSVTRAELLHPDVVQEYPQSRERVAGLDRIERMQAASPAPPADRRWRITELSDSLALAEIVGHYGDEPWWTATFFEADAGRVRRETMYFGPAYPKPEWRAAWVEPITDDDWMTDTGGHDPVTREVVDRWLELTASGDLDAMGVLRHRDWYADLPQSGERFRGWENFLSAHRIYPGGMPSGEGKLRGPDDAWVVAPNFAPLRVAGRGAHWAGEGWLTYRDGQRYLTVLVAGFRDGLVGNERYYYFPPFEPPAWREGISERY